MKPFERHEWRHTGGNIVIVLALALAGCGGGASTDKGAIVAKIGDRPVEMRRITDQIESWHVSYPDDQAVLEARTKVLDRLIQDELLVMGAYSRALDADIGIIELVDREKDKFLLDELFRKEVIEKSIVPDEDIQQAYEVWFERVRPMHIMVETEAEAESIKAALDAGEAFADLAAEHSIDRGTVVRGGDFGREFEWGELMEPIQSVAFQLSEGEYSDPVQSEFGWHIIGVKTRRSLTKKPLDQVQGVILERLKRRAQERRRVEQVEDIQSRANIRIDPDVLAELQRYSDAARDTMPADDPTQPSLPLTEIAAETKSAVFARYGIDNSYTAEEFVEQLNQRPPLGRPKLSNLEEIEDFVFQIGLYDLLREEALRLKIDQEPLYRERLSEFQEKLMADKMRNNLIAQSLVVTEDDVRAFYDSHIDSLNVPEQFHVREIQVSNESFAESILQQVREGADFETLARTHTTRPGFKGNGGDLGWVGPRRYGELYEMASQLAVGEVGGVVPGAGQYSVIKVLERQPARVREYEDAKNSIFSELQKRRTNEIIAAYVDSMKTVYPVVIHEDVLTSGLVAVDVADTGDGTKDEAM